MDIFHLNNPEFTKQITELRNTLHRDLVQEATCKNSIKGNSSHGVLHLNSPMIFGEFIISGLCCEEGLLLQPDYCRIVPYQKLSVYDLVVLHEYVVEKKNYSFKLNTELV